MIALGTAVVLAAGAPVAIEADAQVVQFGERVTLRGLVEGAREGTRVVVERRRFGEGRFRTAAVVQTDEHGAWRIRVRPRIETRWRAVVDGEPSPAVRTRVRPRIAVAVRDRSFTVRVLAARSFVGRLVTLQRRSSGRWVTVRTARLQARPRPILSALPRGASTIRVVLPRAQAGGGYLAGISRAVTVRR